MRRPTEPRQSREGRSGARAPRGEQAWLTDLAALVERLVRSGRAPDAIERIAATYIRDAGLGRADVAGVLRQAGVRPVGMSARALVRRVDALARSRRPLLALDHPVDGPTPDLWRSVAVMRGPAWFGRLDRWRVESALGLHRFAQPLAAPPERPLVRSVVDLRSLAGEVVAFERTAIPAIASPGVYALQRRASEPGTERDAAPSPEAILAELGPGRPLPEAIARRLGAALERAGRGIDPHEIRIHDGTEADRICRRMRATAFALGPHIVFRAGRFVPDSRDGESLILHELVHVWQQRQGLVRGRGVITDGALESDADRVAAEVVAARADAADAGTDAPEFGPAAQPEALQRHEGEEGPQSGAPPAEPAEQRGNVLPRASSNEQALQHMRIVGRPAEYPINTWAALPVTGPPGTMSFADANGAVTEHPLSTSSFMLGRHRLGVGAYWLSRERAGRLVWVVSGDERRFEISWQTDNGFIVGANVPDWGPPASAWRLPMLLSIYAPSAAPTEESAPAESDDRERPHARQVGPTAAQERGQGSANAPPLPMTIEGPDLVGSGGDTVYTARLDYTAAGDVWDVFSQRFVGATYSWQLFDATAASLQGSTEEARDANVASTASDYERRHLGTPEERRQTVSDFGATSRRAQRALQDEGEDLDHQLDAIANARGVMERAAQVAVMLASGATLVPRILGVELRWALELITGGATQEREVEFGRPGVYIVRAIVQPHPHGEERRAPSVKTKVVRVRPPREIARRALNEDDDVHLRTLDAQLELAGGDPVLAARARAARDSYLLRTRGDATAAIGDSLQAKRRELQDARDDVSIARDAERSGRPHPSIAQLEERVARLEDEVEVLQNQQSTASRQAADVARASDGGTVYRPRAVFVNRADGSQMPLILQLGVDTAQAPIRAIVSDVSTPAATRGTGAGATPLAAVRAAFTELGGEMSYGRGWLAVALPDAMATWFGISTADRQLQVDVYPRNWNLVVTRTQQAMATLALVGIVVPPIGAAAAIVGAGIAARNIARRIRNHSVHFDYELCSDLLNVACGTSTFLQLAARGGASVAGAVARRAGERAATATVAGETATAARATQTVTRAEAAIGRMGRFGEALQRIDSAINVVQQSGDITREVGAMMEIWNQEQAGHITHSAAMRQRLDHLEALANILLPHLLAGPAERYHEERARAAEAREQARIAAEQHGTQGEQHGTQAEQHGTQGEQHGTQGEQHGTQGEQHGTQGGQHGTQGGQHGTQGGQHGTQGVQHGGPSTQQGAGTATQAAPTEHTRGVGPVRETHARRPEHVATAHAIEQSIREGSASHETLYEFLAGQTAAVGESRQHAATHANPTEHVARDASHAMQVLRLWFATPGWANGMKPMVRALQRLHAARVEAHAAWRARGEAHEAWVRGGSDDGPEPPAPGPEPPRPAEQEPSATLAAAREWLFNRVLDRVARQAHEKGWAFDPRRDQRVSGSTGADSDLDPTLMGGRGGENTLRAMMAYDQQMRAELEALGLPSDGWRDALGMNPYSDPRYGTFVIEGNTDDARHRRSVVADQEQAMIQARVMAQMEGGGHGGDAHESWDGYVADMTRRAGEAAAQQAEREHGDHPQVIEAARRAAETRMGEIFALAREIRRQIDDGMVEHASQLRTSVAEGSPLLEAVRQMPTERAQLLAWLRSEAGRSVRAEVEARLLRDAQATLQREIDTRTGAVGGDTNRLSAADRAEILRLIMRMKMHEDEAYLGSAHASVVEGQQVRTQSRVESGLGRQAMVSLPGRRHLNSFSEQLQALHAHWHADPGTLAKYLMRAVWDAALVGARFAPHQQAFYRLLRVMRTKRFGRRVGEVVGDGRAQMTHSERSVILAQAAELGLVVPMRQGDRGLLDLGGGEALDVASFRQAAAGMVDWLRGAQAEAMSLSEAELERRTAIAQGEYRAGTGEASIRLSSPEQLEAARRASNERAELRRLLREIIHDQRTEPPDPAGGGEGDGAPPTPPPGATQAPGDDSRTRTNQGPSSAPPSAPSPVPPGTPGQGIEAAALAAVLQGGIDGARARRETDYDAYAMRFWQTTQVTTVDPPFPAFWEQGPLGPRLVVFTESPTSSAAAATRPALRDPGLRTQASRAIERAARGDISGRLMLGEEQGVGREPGSEVRSEAARVLIAQEDARRGAPSDPAADPDARIPAPQRVRYTGDWEGYVREALLTRHDAEAPVPYPGFRRVDGALLVYRPQESLPPPPGPPPVPDAMRQPIRQLIAAMPVETLGGYGTGALPGSHPILSRELRRPDANGHLMSQGEAYAELPPSVRARVQAGQPIAAGTHFMFVSEDAAFHTYQSMIALDPSREVGIYRFAPRPSRDGTIRNPGQSLWVVVQGETHATNDAFAIGSPLAFVASTQPYDWAPERHFHPAEMTSPRPSSNQVPSPFAGAPLLGGGDFGVLWRQSGGGRTAMTRKVDFWAGTGFGSVEFGVDPSHAAEPIFIRWRLPEATDRLRAEGFARFATEADYNDFAHALYTGLIHIPRVRPAGASPADVTPPPALPGTPTDAGASGTRAMGGPARGPEPVAPAELARLHALPSERARIEQVPTRQAYLDAWHAAGGAGADAPAGGFRRGDRIVVFAPDYRAIVERAAGGPPASDATSPGARVDAPSYAALVQAHPDVRRICTWEEYLMAYWQATGDELGDPPVPAFRVQSGEVVTVLRADGEIFGAGDELPRVTRAQRERLLETARAAARSASRPVEDAPGAPATLMPVTAEEFLAHAPPAEGPHLLALSADAGEALRAATGGVSGFRVTRVAQQRNFDRRWRTAGGSGPTPTWGFVDYAAREVLLPPTQAPAPSAARRDLADVPVSPALAGASLVHRTPEADLPPPASATPAAAPTGTATPRALTPERARFVLWLAETSGFGAGVREIAEVTDRPTYQRIWETFGGTGTAPQHGFDAAGVEVLYIPPELNEALLRGHIDLAAGGLPMAVDTAVRRQLPDFLGAPIATTPELRAPIVALTAAALAEARGLESIPGWHILTSETAADLAREWSSLAREVGALNGPVPTNGFLDYHTRTLYLPPAGRARSR